MSKIQKILIKIEDLINDFEEIKKIGVKFLELIPIKIIPDESDYYGIKEYKYGEIEGEIKELQSIFIERYEIWYSEASFLVNNYIPHKKNDFYNDYIEILNLIKLVNLPFEGNREILLKNFNELYSRQSISLTILRKALEQQNEQKEEKLSYKDTESDIQIEKFPNEFIEKLPSLLRRTAETINNLISNNISEPIPVMLRKLIHNCIIRGFKSLKYPDSESIIEDFDKAINISENMGLLSKSNANNLKKVKNLGDSLAHSVYIEIYTQNIDHDIRTIQITIGEFQKRLSELLKDPSLVQDKINSITKPKKPAIEKEKIINKTIKPVEWGRKYLGKLRFLKAQHEKDEKIPHLFEVLEGQVLISIWEIEESKGKIGYYIDFLKGNLTDDTEFNKYKYEYPDNYEELPPNQQDIIVNQQDCFFEHRHGAEEMIEIYPDISIDFNFNIFANLPEAIAELTFFRLRSSSPDRGL